MSSSRGKAAASGSAAASDKSTGSHPGLVNLGNTCFFNSTLQALSATQSLHDLYRPNILASGVSDTHVHDDRGGLLSVATEHVASAAEQDADRAELAVARSKSPVLRLADEEHGRSNVVHPAAGPSSAALEASLRAVTTSGIVANPTPADIASIKGQQDSDAAAVEIAATDIPLNTAFRHVLEKTWDRRAPKGTAINPKQLLSIMARKYDQYGDYKQQDGHELLRHLLDALRMEELDVIKKLDPPVKGKGKERVTSKTVSKYSPLIDNLFCGKLLSAVVCEGCRQVSHTYEDFYDISLSIRPENDSEKASKRQRMRSMADRWRRGGPSKTSAESNGKPVHETLLALRSDMESLSDTEQPDEPVRRSASRLGIIRPKSAADRARIDANSKEGSKKFIKRQMHGDDNGIETDLEALSLDEGSRTPMERHSRVVSAGGASSLLRAVSGRRTPSGQGRSASPSSDGANNTHHPRSNSLHRNHDNTHKAKENRQQQYLARILAETAPTPQAPNISALFWGRRSSVATTEEHKPGCGTPTSAEDIEEKQAATGLARAMHQFTNVEVLDGSNTYACKRCWRLLNPPSAAEGEKQRLRRLRRGKTADDSERSSDDQSSSDEEEKEQRQVAIMPVNSLTAKSRSSISSSASAASLSADDRTSLRTDDKAVSMSYTPPSSQSAGETASIAEKPALVVTTEEGEATSESVSSIATPTPHLRAPKPLKAPLQLGALSSDDTSGIEDSSDDVMTDAEDTGPEPNRIRSRSIRYADDEQAGESRIQRGAGSSQPHNGTVKAELRHKRSTHSLQRRALKRFLIAETPKVLVFHFKRFQATGRTFGSFTSSFKKIEDYVSFPEYLDVKQWVAPPREEYDRQGNLKKSLSDAKALATAGANGTEHDRHHHHHHHHRPHWMRHHKHHHDSPHTPAGRTLYRLYAVVVHQGSMSGGHYTSYVLSDRAIVEPLNGKEEKANGTLPVEPQTTASSRSSIGSNAASSTKEGMSNGDEGNPALPNKPQRERRWVHTSDKSVRVATIDEVLKAQAYMLFYEQV